MKYLLEIWRQKNRTEKGFFRTYLYETDSGDVTVAAALSGLNERKTLEDTEGILSDRIVWECSCLQRKCGACAMLINGRPCLACDTKLSGLKDGRIRLEPLRKFPVIADLMVDREVIFDNLKQMQIWSEGEAYADEKKNSLMYEASRCLQCGCCLEICPNFVSGGNFLGMSAMVPASRLLEGMEVRASGKLRKQFGKLVTDGCGKSLACRNICPAGIDIERLMARSNGAVLWRWLAGRSVKTDKD